MEEEDESRRPESNKGALFILFLRGPPCRKLPTVSIGVPQWGIRSDGPIRQCLGPTTPGAVLTPLETSMVGGGI